MSINISKESDIDKKIESIREYLDNVPTKEEIEKKFGIHTFDDIPYGYIYMVKNSKSGRCYIGQSVQGVSTSKGTFRRYPNGWIMEHFSKPEVKFDLMEYGWGSFEDIKIIALAYSKEELDILEGYWMKKNRQYYKWI